MKTVMKACIISSFFALLIGCSNNQVTQPAASQQQPASSNAAKQAAQDSSSSSNTTKQPSTSSNQSDAASSNQQAKPDQKGSVSVADKALINDIVALAKEGKVKDSEFAVNTNDIDQVKEKWGNPDKQDTLDGNRYATYTSHGIVFGINKGDQIFDVRSFSKEVQQLTFESVKQVLGNPNDVRSDSGDQIWVYNVNDKYQVKFVGSKATVDHISVFYPAASKNNMAG